MGQNRQDRPKTDVAPHKNFENERTPAVRSCLDAWYLRFALDARKRFDAWVPIANNSCRTPPAGACSSPFRRRPTSRRSYARSSSGRDDHRSLGRPRDRPIGDRVRPVDHQEHGVRAGPGTRRGCPRRPSSLATRPRTGPVAARPAAIFAARKRACPRSAHVAILEQLVARSLLGVIEGGRQCRLNARPTRSDGVDHLVGLGLVRRGLCCGRDDRSCSTASPSAAKRATQRCAHCRDTPTSLPYLADCDPLTGQLILA
jgi:hypothetical protein